MRATLLLRAFALSLLARRTSSWVEWSSTGAGPGERAGHSLLIFNDTLFLFGGRGPPTQKLHDPRTFSTARSANGTVEFTGTMNDKHVTACLDAAGAQVEDPLSADYIACYSIDAQAYRNDLWSYALNCSRVGDQPCLPGAADWTHGGWARVHGGAPLGGCINYNETQVCTHPTERTDHVAAVITETAPVLNTETGIWSLPPAQLVVYGGFAQACGDYCSDMWAFAVTACGFDASRCTWREVGSLGRRGPGKRRRAAVATDNTRLVIFGGHRLWHGFATENSEANAWSAVAPSDSNADSPLQPFGGFLDDLWVFVWDSRGQWQAAYNGTANPGYGQGAFGGDEPADAKARELTLGRVVTPDTCAGLDCSFAGAWQQVIPREDCHLTPGPSFQQRNDVTCTVTWPPAREGGALVMRSEDLFLMGGHTTASFPYPHPLGAGAGPGVSALKSDTPSMPGVYPFEVRGARAATRRARKHTFATHPLPTRAAVDVHLF